MMCRLTINPTLVSYSSYICRWRMALTNSQDKETEISNGEIRPEKSHSDPIKVVTEKLIELYKVKTAPQKHPMELKFDLTTYNSEEKTINAIDLFRLYGLLSTKLNPLTIDISS